MQERQTTRIFQHVTRLFVLVLITYFALMHQMEGVLIAPNAHAFCPFGGLESLYKLLASGGYIQKIFPATMVLFVGSIIMTIALNRAFCGWICPLGTLQMFFDRIGRFFNIKKIQAPAAVEKYLGMLKYAGLVIITYFTWKVGDLVYAPYDPWAAFVHIGAGVSGLYAEFLIGSIFLLVALIGSLWLPNNFCRYFCPMGAFLSIFAKFSPTKIYRNQSTCINCKKCDSVCPVQIEISTQPAVKSMQCLSCGDCVHDCPVENTLTYKIGSGKNFRWLVYGVAAIVLFFAPVLLAKQLDIWKTNFANITESVKDDTGVSNPYNLKGSVTLKAMLDEFKVPKDVFFQKFKLPADTKEDALLKDIARANSLEVSDFRTFIAEYLQQQNPDLKIEKPATTENH